MTASEGTLHGVMHIAPGGARAGWNPARLESLVRRHGGRWLDSHGGEARAAFPSVGAAVNASIGIQHTIGGAAVRIAIDAGDVSIADGRADGPPVQGAMTLCQLAEPGEVLMAPRARTLVDLLPQLEQGKSGDASRLGWQPVQPVSRRMGLPAQLTPPDGPFAGRDGERASLRRALDAAVGGTTGWVTVIGAAGLGKSRLVSEFAREAYGRDVSVLLGAAEEVAAPPYAPVVALLEHWVEHVEGLDYRLGLTAAELVRILPVLAERIPDLPDPIRSDAESERRRLFEAVAEAIREIAADGPAVLILESLHWQGDPTIDMLLAVLPLVRGLPLLVITTQRVRDARAERLLAAATDCFGAQAVHALELEPLSRDAVAEIIAAAAPQSTGLVDAVHLASGGHPLHLGALLQSPTLGALSDDTLPATLQAALEQRINMLDGPLRRVVDAAAVLGDTFVARELSELLGDSDEAFDLLDELAAEGIVQLVDPRTLTYQFAHALLRERAHALMGNARRARLHEHAAVALEGKGELVRERRTFELARHYGAAAPLGHHDKAIYYARLAAQVAFDQYANQDAVVLFQAALDLLGDDDDPRARCELQIGLGRTLQRLGDASSRDVLLECADRAAGIGDGDLQSVALLSVYRGTFSRALQVDQELVERLRRALQLLGDARSANRARVMSHLAVELVWADDRREALELSREAMHIAESLRDPTIHAEAMAHHQWVCFHPLDERLEVATQLQALTHPDPRVRFEIACHEVFTATRLADRARYENAITSCRNLAQEIAEPAVQSLLLLYETTGALGDARFADVQRLMGQRLELENALGSRDGQGAWRVQSFWLGFDTMPAAAGRALIEQMAGARAHLPRYQSWAPLAAFACECGVEQLAEPLLVEMSNNQFGDVPVDQVWLSNLCQLALAAAALEDVPRAAQLLELLQPHEDLHANMVFASIGSVARYVALLQEVTGAHEAARASLRAALASNAAMGLKSWQARAALDLAELLQRAGGDAGEAKQLIDTAHDIAKEFHLPTVQARAQGLATG